MPTIGTDGIATHYEISGSGAPILLMAPGDFDSAIEKWSTTWPWQHFYPSRPSHSIPPVLPMTAGTKETPVGPQSKVTGS